MMICDNEDCKLWLHQECLIDDILTKTYERLVKDSEEAPDTNGIARTNGKKGKSSRKIWKGLFEAKFTDSGEAEHTEVIITDLRNKTNGAKIWTERVACLKCGTVLE
jgi:hypothetical protein